jgi:hypothetical protein
MGLTIRAEGEGKFMGKIKITYTRESSNPIKFFSNVMIDIQVFFMMRQI